jgi:hypothetical protein
MSATALHPKSALPAMEDQTPPRVEKWKTSPGGPLERHVQTSSGENAQTSSGEHAGDAGSDLSDPNDDETNTETAVDLECHEPVMVEAKRPRLRRHDVAEKTKEEVKEETDADKGGAAAEAEDATPEKATGGANEHAASNPTETKKEDQSENEQKASSTQEMLRQAMSTRQLQSKYEEIFGVPTKVHNKDWILNKIREKVELELPTAQPPTSPNAKSQKRAQAGTGTASGGATAKAKEGGGTKKGGAAAVEVPAGQIRCSRNDGKNWRCSEMAVSGHKHCPKHMRWSAGSRNAAASKHQGANGGVKRPRWMPDPAAKDVHRGGMPFGAQNPFLASPLLSAAASALDELHHKENMMRALGGMMPTAFGFGRWPASVPAASAPGSATARPTPSKVPFSFENLHTTATAAATQSTMGASAVASAAAAVAALAAASAGMAGSLPPSVSCTVELATFPAAGDTTGQGETGPTVHRTLSLATLASFDALHCTLASIAGAPPPVGGRYNPSTLQVAYTDEHGVPRVLGGETWPVFMASARTLHARILVTKETLAAASPAAAQPVPSTTLATPAAPPQLPPGTMFNPFMMAMMSGGNPAGVPAPPAAPPIDPNAMYMAMMMYAAAGGGMPGTPSEKQDGESPK